MYDPSHSRTGSHAWSPTWSSRERTRTHRSISSATRRDDLGGATALNPNERYSYQYATVTTPASVYLSTLIDATSASARDQVELATSTGEAIGTVTRIPEGWAFGRLVSRSRARSEAQGALRDGGAATLSPTARDYSARFTGTSASAFAGRSGLAGS